eukprot:SAG22_NODE_1572_length_4093_cov_18.988733_4_plen_219_part_00
MLQLRMPVVFPLHKCRMLCVSLQQRLHPITRSPVLHSNIIVSAPILELLAAAAAVFIIVSAPILELLAAAAAVFFQRGSAAAQPIPTSLADCAAIWGGTSRVTCCEDLMQTYDDLDCGAHGHIGLGSHTFGRHSASDGCCSCTDNYEGVWCDVPPCSPWTGAGTWLGFVATLLFGGWIPSMCARRRLCGSRDRAAGWNDHGGERARDGHSNGNCCGCG